MLVPRGRPWRHCCGFTVLYLGWGAFVELSFLWAGLHELPFQCEHPQLPANQSGVKVVVAGVAKTGTRTMSRALYQIGMGRSYHSEDFGMFVWSNLVADTQRWLARGGGDWSPLPGQSNASGVQEAELAGAISSCRADAVAVDGIEKALGPVLRVSPEAKVILLNWRTFEDWRRSLDTFLPLLCLEIAAVGSLQLSLVVLPWGWLVPLLDPMLGHRIENRLRTGGPPFCQVYDAWTALFHGLVHHRRMVGMWSSGIGHFPETAHEYDAFHADIKASIPQERLFEWDMRKHGFEDLCGFLDVKPCPHKGRLPRAINSFFWQRDFPSAALGKIVVLVAFHWINFKILAVWLPSIIRGVWPARKAKCA